MRITADTNVLVRAAVLDDPPQAALAVSLLRDENVIAVTLAALCEFAWVLGRGYRWSGSRILGFILTLLRSANVQVDRPAVEAGLAMLTRGGDFADGVIAYEGRRLGGEVFASFDRQAVELVAAAGASSYLVGASAT
ncbi:MAG: type II toxin-antitoxin system VapC family toxin [Alphaproteobacteria bacterium]|nr:type II toxin-antitoxin system VapC family toxin [Alphaproteobacteria bacterium]